MEKIRQRLPSSLKLSMSLNRNYNLDEYRTIFSKSSSRSATSISVNFAPRLNFSNNEVTCFVFRAISAAFFYSSVCSLAASFLLTLLIPKVPNRKEKINQLFWDHSFRKHKIGPYLCMSWWLSSCYPSPSWRRPTVGPWPWSAAQSLSQPWQVTS